MKFSARSFRDAVLALACGASLLAAADGACQPTNPAGNPFRFTALYSDQAGVYQYILLQRLTPGQGSLAGLTLTVTSRTGVVKQLTIPNDAAGLSLHSICVATQSVSPIVDILMPDRFLPTGGGTITLGDVDEWTFGPLPTDGHSARYRSTGGDGGLALLECSRLTAVLEVPVVSVIEYWNPALDHYFISGSQPDLDALDSGRFTGWQRTGHSFPAWVTRTAGEFGGFVAPPNLQDVCRIYMPPAIGDSHFYSASAGECAQSLANEPRYVLETQAAFLATLPDRETGACPPGQIPVFRLWNQRADSNHRYATSRFVRSQMLEAGFMSEGYGPDGVAFCAGGSPLAPQIGGTP
ncbi:MAG: hypothetical protein IT518_00330 [Burkholderiales bacterium]|nr:hypothetical protein [Burkholderiales bacterium]